MIVIRLLIIGVFGLTPLEPDHSLHFSTGWTQVDQPVSHPFIDDLKRVNALQNVDEDMLSDVIPDSKQLSRQVSLLSQVPKVDLTLDQDTPEDDAEIVLEVDEDDEDGSSPEDNDGEEQDELEDSDGDAPTVSFFYLLFTRDSPVVWWLMRLILAELVAL